MTDTSIFGGMSLSKPVDPESSAAVDQRLFGTPTTSSSLESIPSTPTTATATALALSSSPAQTVAEPSLAQANVGKEGKRETGEKKIPLESARLERPLTSPSAKTSSPFDINDKPWRKDSFLFTDSEFERLEDFKLELRRRFDLKATKNDIARAAFQYLYEEYSHDPERSSIVRHLRKKKV